MPAGCAKKTFRIRNGGHTLDPMSPFRFSHRALTRGFALVVLASVLPGAARAGTFLPLPALEQTWQEASARVVDGQLVVSTGRFARSWRLAPSGLSGQSIGLIGNETRAERAEADWQFPGWLEGPATLVKLEAGVSDDEGFTSRHLRVVAEFHYAANDSALRYEIWAYPGAAGLRTQLWVRGPAEARTAGADPARARTETIPFRAERLHAIGYYNDTQHRHEPGLPLLREEQVDPGVIDWANVLCAENGDRGVALVKESHKCVNQSGVQTGAFVAGATSIGVTGWGLAPGNARADRWQWAWATWLIGYDVRAPRARELAIKGFDRLRFPVRPDRDPYIKANTWGSGATSAESVARASEAEVLAEIDSIAELGIESLQIDDGWQSGRMIPKPPASQEWDLRPDWYPSGWSNVVAKAEQRRISLGLWLAARAPLAVLQRHYAEGHFTTWKLDFANLSRYEGVYDVWSKARQFVSGTQHRVRVNWDVTENAPRFGYFWAREFGNVWLANRKPQIPANVVARPALMLREVWELSRYLNVTKFELPIVNFAQVDPARSDARDYSDDYSVALGLPGIPVFFQTTRLLTSQQRARVKALLGHYKSVRRELFAATVLPIGNRPDGASWTGFQWLDPQSRHTYVLVFRERGNTEERATLALHGVQAGQVSITDLQQGSSRMTTATSDGRVEFVAASPGAIVFARVTARSAH